MLYSWTDLIESMKLMKRKSDFDWFFKGLQRQEDSETAYVPSIKQAIEQVMIPYSQKALLFSLEVMTMFPQYK